MAVAVRARLNLDQVAIDRLTTGDTGLVMRFMRGVARDVRTRAVILAPKRTGELARSVFSSVEGHVGRDVQVVVGATADHAVFVHEGTRPHVILPRRPGGVLRFVVDGQVVFATRVNHPGTRPNPFLTDAMKQVAVPRGFRIVNS